MRHLSAFTGSLKTRPVQNLLVRVQFTDNSYSYRTRINVNDCYWNTCKIVFLITRTRTWTQTRTRTRINVNAAYVCHVLNIHVGLPCTDNSWITIIDVRFFNCASQEYGHLVTVNSLDFTSFHSCCPMCLCTRRQRQTLS